MVTLYSIDVFFVHSFNSILYCLQTQIYRSLLLWAKKHRFIEFVIMDKKAQIYRVCYHGQKNHRFIEFFIIIMGEKHRHYHVYSKKEQGRIILPSQPNKLYIYMYRQLYTHKQRSEFCGASVGLVSNHALYVYLLQQFIHSRNPFSLVHDSLCSGGGSKE